MKTKAFIARLREAPDNQLIFKDAHGKTVPPGYHLTELKAVAFHAVDCGGKVNRWDETHAQLWVPRNADDEYMTAGKFIEIFDKVSGMVPLNLRAEIRIEYGDDNVVPAPYGVESIQEEFGRTTVSLDAPRTACKARDRLVEESSGKREACCGKTAVACC